MLRGLIPYSALIDGSVNLCDIADLNDAIDVADENAARIEAATREKNG